MFHYLELRLAQFWTRFWAVLGGAGERFAGGSADVLMIGLG
jgi:hypothetical protein